jgi:hypothetical protein
MLPDEKRISACKAAFASCAQAASPKMKKLKSVEIPTPTAQTKKQEVTFSIKCYLPSSRHADAAAKVENKLGIICKASTSNRFSRTTGIKYSLADNNLTHNGAISQYTKSFRPRQKRPQPLPLPNPQILHARQIPAADDRAKPYGQHIFDRCVSCPTAASSPFLF